jgi:Domain of unknown function (DUF4105)
MVKMCRAHSNPTQGLEWGHQHALICKEEWKEKLVRIPRTVRVVCYLVILLTNAWAVIALGIDLPWSRFRIPAAMIYGAALASIIYLLRGKLGKQLAAGLLCFACVLGWWLTLKPSNDGDWNPDFARPAWGEIDGDLVTIHNVRHCDYQTELEFTCQWYTRPVNLNDIESLDLFMNYWGSPLIAHTILSFHVREQEPIVFSIETRRQKGQIYSALLGFFRRFTLFSVVSDERDVVRVRTNFRHGEDLYLYRTTATREFARSLFLNYIGMVNQLHDHPQWYNAITHNCTTEIYTLKSMRTQPYDWRILLNGKGDEMAYEKDMIVTGGLPFKELKHQAWINRVAKGADNSPDFSMLIREGRPGF